MILGIDEAGRGPWAGPLVVGAVVLGTAQIEGLDDSKKLSKKRREQLYELIIERANATATGWVSAEELDSIGMSEALRLATRRAVEQIQASYHEIIIDGTVNFLAGTAKGRYVTTLAKADSLIGAVSAASIIAKVARDRYMTEQDALYPVYGFARHAGYGTAAHRQAIDEFGVTLLHRLSFAPLQGYASTQVVCAHTVSHDHKLPELTTRHIGDSSEDAAALELQKLGHDIIVRNWRTKVCEIDIVSRRDDTLYFTEVKHRRSDKAGDGLAAITPAKLDKMKFAAKCYIHAGKLEDKIPQRLMVVATTGDEPRVTDVLELE